LAKLFTRESGKPVILDPAFDPSFWRDTNCVKESSEFGLGPNGEGHLAACHVEQTRLARVHAATTEARESQEMRIPILLRGALVALIALFGVGLQNANANSGSITLTIYKGGWIIGGSPAAARSPFAAAAMGLELAA